MTAVLPLTEDEERALREEWATAPRALCLRSDALRLLATLDAERAKGTVAVVDDAGLVERVARTIFIDRDGFTPEDRKAVYPDGMTKTWEAAPEWERDDYRFAARSAIAMIRATPSAPAAAPSPSRSEARRIAAQRGEPAPVFDYPASVVEAVRALECWVALMRKPAPVGPEAVQMIADLMNAEALAESALASLPKELRDAARAPR